MNTKDILIVPEGTKFPCACDVQHSNAEVCDNRCVLCGGTVPLPEYRNVNPYNMYGPLDY